jgi:hypothetical protein
LPFDKTGKRPGIRRIVVPAIPGLLVLVANVALPYA